MSSTIATEALCVDTSYSEERDEIANGKIIKYRKSISTTNADIVLMMDVLEHVDDDVNLLREYVEKVPVGTYFLITVPAFSFLWSGHDVYLDHKRRYTLNEIKSVIKKTNLEIEYGTYFFGLVFPIAAILRLFDRSPINQALSSRSHLKNHNFFVNKLLLLICTIDRLLIFPANKLAGLSVFCLAKKT